MAESEEIEINAPKGNEWEVVSLTASAYAASPAPEYVGTSEGGQHKLGSENEPAAASSLMFMSGHFVFPPNQHENLPLEPKYSENEIAYDVSKLVSEESDPRITKDEKHSSIEDLVSRDFSGIPIFDEKGNFISVNASDYGNKRVFDEEQRNTSIEPLDHASESCFENFEKLDEGCDDANLPCEAWWKRRAFSIYRHAKEANAIWSVLVTAAVMGLVIIGHKWQQERWQILHLKWQAGINRERMGWFLGPISRFKDVIVGVHRPSLLVRGSDSSQL